MQVNDSASAYEAACKEALADRSIPFPLSPHDWGAGAERSIPPLDQHLQSLSNEKTRIGKVYDFLLGEMCDDLEHPPGELIVVLHATEAYHELPNRKRLIALVEAAMPKEHEPYRPTPVTGWDTLKDGPKEGS